MEKRVLYDFEFDILFEAGTAQGGGVLGVETGDVRKVEIGVFSQLRGYLLDNLSFQFLFMVFVLLNYSAVALIALVSMQIPGLIVADM